MKQITCFDFMGRSILIIRRPPRRAPVAASFSLPPPFGQQQQRRAVRREHGDDRAWRRLRRSPIDTSQPGGDVVFTFKNSHRDFRSGFSTVRVV